VAKAKIFAAQKKPEVVIDTYKAGLEVIPNNVQLRVLLASLYEGQKDYDNAIKNYEAIVSKQPNVDVAVNNLVSLLLDHYPGEDSSVRALELAKRFENSEQPYFYDTYGWALLKAGEFKKSLPVFEKVVSQKSDVPVFKYHLGLAYATLDMYPKAVAVLEEVLVSAGNDESFLEKDLAVKLLADVRLKLKPEIE